TAGKEKAFAAFDDPKGGFVDRDLYVFAMDFQGTMLAHGGNKSLIGKTMLGIKDNQGREFFKQFVETAKGPGKGWVDYNWVNPLTKKLQAKSSLIHRVDGDMLLGVGIYK
ncbi:MAG: cache domain-containing protein, partial [Alphaproteobacteria bacterium]|nr:cache domain-containing protein [Alphaproteobacteria bacterium]